MAAVVLVAGLTQGIGVLPSPSLPPHLRVCTGKTCRADGSALVLRRFEQLACELGGFEAAGCSCLGQCGNGPNVVALTCGAGEPRRFVGVRKAATIAAVLEVALGIDVPEPLVELQATASRARRLASQGLLAEAARAYDDGLRAAGGYSSLRAELQAGMQELRERMRTTD
ncbi:hypothetical protein KFE25_005063 [Diacronema lutheri]|uniref:DUF1636 domain-containing protein n=1 Tax=Diacronema lutheri TaxID=2081491 RepID=A0A8J5XB49_DIALT|nr:hypothetical protein KFE25_005063 [Diacronema lutheri]